MSVIRSELEQQIKELPVKLFSRTLTPHTVRSTTIQYTVKQKLEKYKINNENSRLANAILSK